MTITEGIVLRERSVGEQDKFIDILTKEQGVIEISVKGAKKINGKSGSSTQLFAYSRFCINSRKDRFYLNSAEPIHIFYGLRNSLSRLALASYFAEVVLYCIQERTDGEEILRLFLNTLHYLEKGLRSEEMLKCIFEFRLMSETGYMPDIIACRVCGCFEPEKVRFSISDGSFRCFECSSASDSGDEFIIELPVLSAIRHIVLTDYNRMYNFRVSDKILSKLSAVSEAYIKSHLERGFSTLEFYHGVK